MDYEIDLNIGYDCNFRCKYCFEKLGDKQYRSECMSNEVIEHSISYIQHLLDNVFEKTDNIKLMFFGGEPLLHIDIIEHFVKVFKDNDRVRYHIVTNGTLVKDNIDALEQIRNISNNRLSFSVSYDYALQNKNRQSGTYDIVRNAIILLHKRNFPTNTITVFPRGDLSLFFEVVFDFLKLRRIIPNIIMAFNIDRINSSNTVFDEEMARNSLRKTRKMLSSITDTISDVVRYNNSCRFRGGQDKNCIVGSVYIGITVNGDIYPMYNVLHAPQNIRKMLYMGNVISDDLDTLDKNHTDLFDRLNFKVPEECTICNAPCRVLPWRTIKNGTIEEFNGMPDEEHCLIHKILAEELDSYRCECE